MQYSDYVLNTYLAPNAAAFVKADIPDMDKFHPQSEYWVANYFLNSMVGAKFKFPMNAYAFNFLRRTVYAFVEYKHARNATLRFLSSGSQSVSKYTEALFHWETFLGQSWHAYALLVAAFGGRVFERGDGSVEQRLNALYNEMKHVESRIENGQIVEGATVPVWLENDGLCSVDTRLSFLEASEVLADLAGYANALERPADAGEELAKLHPES